MGFCKKFLVSILNWSGKIISSCKIFFELISGVGQSGKVVKWSQNVGWFLLHNVVSVQISCNVNKTTFKQFKLPLTLLVILQHTTNTLIHPYCHCTIEKRWTSIILEDII